MIKIPYNSLPFKTNRNIIAKYGAGMSAPLNINNRVKNVKITSLKLPAHVYHMSTTPISEFTKNRIFYVSFSMSQAFMHVSQYRSQMRLSGKTKLYMYTLKPRKRVVQAIIFNKNYRPKNISNGFGIKYDTFGPSAMRKLMSNSGNNIKNANINSENFKEGSGDNMILGYLLCSKIKNINGIRNEINQDEFAVCNPKDFFTIYDKTVLDIAQGKGTLKKGTGPGTKLPREYEYSPGHLPNMAEPNIINIEFKRNNNGTSRYVPKSRHVKESNFSKLLQKYGTSKIQIARAKQSLRSLTNKKPKTFLQMLSGAIRKKRV